MKSNPNRFITEDCKHPAEGPRGVQHWCQLCREAMLEEQEDFLTAIGFYDHDFHSVRIERLEVKKCK